MISRRDLKKGNEVFADLEPETLRGYLERGRKQGAFEKYFSEGVCFQNVDSLRDLLDSQLLFIGNHISHFDYLLAATLFLDNLPGERFPHIIAGNSLNVPYLSKLIGFDYTKAGVCWIDRKRASGCDRDYLRFWGDKVKERLDEGDNFMVYPEGTRVLNGEKRLNNCFGGGFFGKVLESSNDRFIVPLTVAYDNPIEEPFADIISWARKKKSYVPEFVSNAIYYGTDLLAFSTRQFRGDTGKAYLRVGEPRRLDDVVEGASTKRDKIHCIRDFVCSTIARDYVEINGENRYSSVS